MRSLQVEKEFGTARGTAPGIQRIVLDSGTHPLRHLVHSFLILVMLLAADHVNAAATCLVDTSQANFQLGVPNNVNLLSSGDVTLASAGTVDQQNTTLSSSGFTFHSYWWVGQTFVAGVSGPLTAADLRLFCNACSGTMPDITVSIRAVSNDLPTGADLATATIPGFSNAGGAWFTATFANPINMVAGTKYAVIARANQTLPAGTSYAYLVSPADTTYAAGTRVQSMNAGTGWDVRTYDIGFRIYSGSGYVAAGDLVSGLKDSNPEGGSNPTWSTISWGSTTPVNTTLKFHAAGSNSSSGPFSFVGPNGTAGTFFTSSGADLSQFDGLRYLKYKALLSSSSSSATPTLKDATVCYDNVGGTASADLQITKTDGTATETPGSAVTYTIVASNAGPSSVTGATVSDTFAASLQSCTWTCSGASGGSCASPSGSGNINHGVNLPSGGSATFTASCTISASASGSLANTASISSTVSDPVPGNNSATDTDTLGGSANLGITKTDGAASETPGTAVTYTIVASNAGPSNVTGATVTDSFPAALQSCSWTCAGANGGSCAASGSGNISQSVNLPVNGTATFTASCTVAASATGSLANTASISSAVSDPVPGNNSATDTDTLTGSANLGITKTDSATVETPGTAVTYTIVASNAGPSNVTGATVADSFPASLQSCTWTCSGASGGTCAAPSGSGNISQNVNLPVGGTATYTASCTVSASATGSLANTASISSSTSDPVPGNNSATDTDTLTASANLGITKTDGVTTATAGSSVIYTIVASNAGPGNVSGATVTDTFPSSKLENCEWICSGSGGGSCTGAGAGNISQTVNLPAGGSTVFEAICDIKSNATGSLSNTATVSSSVADPVAGNNSATDTDTLGAVADLGIDIDNETGVASPGGQASFSIVAVNSGSSPVTDASIENTLPPGMNCSWTSTTSGGATSTPSGNGPINDTVNLPVLATATYNVDCAIAPNAQGSLVVGVTVSSSVPDPALENNSASDSITVQTEIIFRSSFD